MLVEIILFHVVSEKHVVAQLGSKQGSRSKKGSHLLRVESKQGIPSGYNSKILTVRWQHLYDFSGLDECWYENR